MSSFDCFVALSEELCGIPAFYLLGTGYAETYYATCVDIVGPEVLERLLAKYKALPTCCQSDRSIAIEKILQDYESGALARNIIKLWYLSTWFALPDDWCEKYGVAVGGPDFIPTSYAYTESLLGPAVGAHPAGAKPTGHQSWVSPPDFLPFAEPTAPAICGTTK